MSSTVYTVEQIANIVTPIAKKYDVSKLYLFGSYARGEADEKSDIDLRVDGGRLGNLFALGGFYADLEKALNKSLDLVTTETLRQNICKATALLHPPHKNPHSKTGSDLSALLKH